MAELEKQTILSTITQLNGDKLLAARLLGIGKTTLYRKLKEYSARSALSRIGFPRWNGAHEWLDFTTAFSGIKSVAIRVLLNCHDSAHNALGASSGLRKSPP